MTQHQDFRLMIGDEPFDPLDVPPAPAGLAAARKAVIVQFAAALSEPDADRVRAAYGLALDRFIPNLAFLERLDDATVTRVRADFLVRSVIPFAPASKLVPWIPATGTLTLIATLFADADAPTVGTALSALGARDVLLTDDRPLGGHQYAGFTLDDRTKLAQIAALDDVVLIQPVPEREVTDVPAAEVQQSGRTGAGSEPVWDHLLHGEGQVIGLLDQGHVDLEHCFFNDPDEKKANEDHRKVLGMFDQNFDDVSNHFMFVAGIVAGDHIEVVDGKPVHQDPHRGAAWAAKLVCRSFLDLPPRQVGKTLLQMFDEAKELGAAIHSNSWSDKVTTYNVDAVSADEFSRKNEEHVVIAAAGNSTDHPPVNGAPGIAKNTLCVGASQGFPGQMTFGSGIPGPTADGRRKPDLMAVGNGIQSALPRKTPGSGVFCDTGPYFKSPELAATSWATPNAAAAAALVRQYFQEGWSRNGKKEDAFGVTPTGALIRAVLLNSTVDMTGVAGYPSTTEGWGLIQLDRTLFFDKTPPSPRRLFVKDVRHSSGLLPQTTARHRFFVGNSAEQLKITLVWTDIPAFEGSTQTWRNVIRLDVEDPLGTQYLGNDIDTTTGLSKAGGTGPQDFVNNVQMVIVDDPFTGPWKITLRGSFVFEKQGYALVVSGG